MKNAAFPSRILHILQCTNLGGTEQATAASMAAIQRDYSVAFRIVSPRAPGKGWDLFTAFDPEARWFPYRGKYNWRGQKAFTAYVRTLAKNCDSVWVSGTCASSLRAARATGLPIVLSHHYHHGRSYLSRLRWKMFYETFGRNLHHIIYVSDFIRNEAIAICPWIAEKSSVVHQPVPAVYNGPEERHAERLKARRDLGLPGHALIVGNGGWLVPAKRFDVFLDVAAKVCRTVPNSFFVICGDGKAKPALMQQAAALGIEDRVRFTGWVKDMLAYHRAWDILLFNSDAEAAGRTVLEAMSCGTPVVASVTHGGTADILSDPARGYFLPVHDTDKLAARIIRLHSDPALREKIAETAADYIRREYSSGTGKAILSAFT